MTFVSHSSHLNCPCLLCFLVVAATGLHCLSALHPPRRRVVVSGQRSAAKHPLRDRFDLCGSNVHFCPSISVLANFLFHKLQQMDGVLAHSQIILNYCISLVSC